MCAGGCSQALVFVVPRDALKRLGLEVRPRCAGENARVFACMRAVAQKDAMHAVVIVGGDR
jgi:hypothetical protein